MGRSRSKQNDEEGESSTLLIAFAGAQKFLKSFPEIQKAYKNSNGSEKQWLPLKKTTINVCEPSPIRFVSQFSLYKRALEKQMS